MYSVYSTPDESCHSSNSGIKAVVESDENKLDIFFFWDGCYKIKIIIIGRPIYDQNHNDCFAH